MGSSRSSHFAWQLSFACLALIATSKLVLAQQPAGQVLQSGQVPSIQFTLAQQPASLLHLETRSTPLAQILKAISDKTGAQIHYSVLPEAPVTATCVGTNVGQVMDCLVGKQIGLIAHKPQKDKPAEFWLLGSSVGSCQTVTVAASPLPIQPPTAPQPTPAELAQVERLVQEQSDSFVKQAQSKDPYLRAEAIGNLGAEGAKNDPAVDEVLHNAMNDKEASVRVQAINAIIQRGGEDAAQQISQALKDKDTQVRLTALSNVTDDALLLQQALGDNDQAVRDLAKDKLADLASRENKAK